MWRNSLGKYSTSDTFIPAWYNKKPAEFKPLEYKRIYYEDCETKTAESLCGASHEAQSGITPQNQQTTTWSTE